MDKKFLTMGLAALAVLAIVVTAAAVVDDAEAAPGNPKTIDVVVVDPSKVTFTITMTGPGVEAGITHTGAWASQTASATPADETSIPAGSSPGTAGKSGLTLWYVENITDGVYKYDFTAEGGDALTGVVKTEYLRFTLTSTGTEGNQGTLEQTFDFTVNMKFVGKKAADIWGTAKLPGDTASSEVTFDLKTAEPKSIQLKAYDSGTSSTTLSGKWYATNLPDGMTMSSTGLLSGQPVVAGDPVVKVVIVDSNNVGHHGTFKMKITDSRVDVTVTRGTVSSASGDLNTIGENRYMVYSGDEMTINLTANNLAVGDVMKVNWINELGVSTTLATIENTSETGVKFTPAGAGECVLEVEFVQGGVPVKVLPLMSVLVIEKIDDVKADIGFSFAV